METGLKALIGCVSTPLGALAVFAAVMLMLVNGWTDAPVNIATAIHSKAIKPRTAVFICGLCNFCGALAMCFFGSSLAVSIYSISGLATSGAFALPALISAMLSVVVWALFALKFGLPTSESHALMAALSGSAVAVGGFSAISYGEWLKALIGILLSILPVAVVSYFTAHIFKIRIDLPQSTFKRLQVLGAALSSFSHGAQDGQKLAGVLALSAVLGSSGREAAVTIPIWTVLISATVISLGTLLGGRKIIKKFKEFAPTDPAAGFASDLVSAVGLLILSVFGLPASTTHAKSSAVFGAGLSGHRLNTRLHPFKWMAFVWILTFPVAAALGFFFTKCLITLL